MHTTLNKLRSRLIVLVAVAATGCQSAIPLPGAVAAGPTEPARSACQKADSMWNDKILVSRYPTLPPLTSPGLLDLLTLTTGDFSVKALSAGGDELEAGRNKLIHSFGAEARLRLVISDGAGAGYSGIFRSGAQCMIGRFSLATRPDSESSIPGLALKIFIDGAQPSVNLHLMHSIDGEAGHNFFGHTFSNILPPPEALSKRLLANGFRRSAQQFGARDPDPGRLTLEHLAGTLTNGKRDLPVKAPYQILFQPTPQARALMRDASVVDDFRVRLAQLKAGQALYEVVAREEGAGAEQDTHLGQLVLTAPVVSSHYGDEKLYFQHNMARN
ncbi:MAG TPA: hypothetical protein VN663_09560 [Ramlibacter sp.]|nr:hypothetical protein [Ramlibacter sp.]